MLMGDVAGALASFDWYEDAYHDELTTRVCSISTVLKRPERKHSIFCTKRASCRKDQFAKERLCAASCIETINVIGSNGDT